MTDGTSTVRMTKASTKMAPEKPEADHLDDELTHRR